MDTLFDLDEPARCDREGLRARLAKPAARNIFIGGSSWKYEDWLGQIYSRAAIRRAAGFSPYDRVQDVNQYARDSCRKFNFGIVEGRPAFIFVNNRLEGTRSRTIVLLRRRSNGTSNALGFPPD